MPDATPQAIGGYFGLELAQRGAWHCAAVAVNSGRNALAHLLRARSPKKVYVPLFTCAAIPQTIARLGMAVAYYPIDEALEPVFDYRDVADDEVFLYTNYFGLKDDYVRTLPARGCAFIIDNAQSFFSPRVGSLDTFYSPRKFFGVPDGGYALGGPATHDDGAPLERDHSSTRASHLLIRHDESAQAGYASYQANEGMFVDLPVRAMSALTERILDSIDYALVAARRQENFLQLHRALGSSNALPIGEDSGRVALSYPYLTYDTSLKSRLQAHQIFTANYWPEVAQAADPASVEYRYCTQIVHLPIDQRYGAIEMQRILELILS